MKELDIPYIKKTLKEKHYSFLSATGNLSNKVSGDHSLTLAKITSKMGRVLQEFCFAGVIDSYENIKSKYLVFIDDRYISGIVLSKAGYAAKVIIWSDGKTIMFQSSGIPFDGIEDAKVIAMRDICVENFDGKEFADKLIEYVHKVIYSSKEVYDQKLKKYFE